MYDKLLATAHGLLGVMQADIEDDGYAECRKDEYDTIKALVDALEEAEKQIPRWMSGLPEGDGKYLVWITFPHGGFESIKYYSQDREKVDEYEMRGKGAGFYGYGDDGNFCVDDVEYWMPLPKGAEETK